MTSLETKQLTIEIGDVSVCRNLSVNFKSGEVWSVLGKNGVGKSTLLHSLAGLQHVASGNILLGDIPLKDISLKKRAQTIGILFQEQDPSFPGTVLETTLTGRHPWLSLFEGEGENDFELATQALKQLDLDGMEQRALGSLSGGERRRVDIAALLLQQPQIVLLDEPVNHLDLHYQIDVIGNLVETWRNKGGIVIMVMHDVNLAMRFSDHLLLLFGNGETYHGHTEDLAMEEVFSRLYGHPLRRYPANGKHFFVPL
jgi:iron complex transport system ATP-binding protein